MTRLMIALGVLTLTACESATLPPRRSADVYEFRLPTTPPAVLHWRAGTTVRVYVSSDAATRATLADALAAGAAEWNRYALFAEYRLQATTSLDDADVVLRWMHEPSELDLTGCLPAGARAVTTFCLADPDSVAAGLYRFPAADGAETDVRMVVSVLGSEATIAGRVASLVTHELGHVLGIAQHSDVAADLMAETQLSRTTLSARDAATVQTLYHTRPDLVP
ncbi:MAG TPA: matrixin family metalloprotease [Longimicrobiales bacterium]|nr:matrixin family metalloprotease [Longimicrobiales bacterium]